MMRRLAIDMGIPFLTTVQGAAAAAAAIEEVRSTELAVKSLQAFAEENTLASRPAGRRGKG